MLFTDFSESGMVVDEHNARSLEFLELGISLSFEVGEAPFRNWVICTFSKTNTEVH